MSVGNESSSAAAEEMLLLFRLFFSFSCICCQKTQARGRLLLACLLSTVFRSYTPRLPRPLIIMTKKHARK